MALLDMEPLLDMIKIVLQTGYVKNRLFPVNLLIIAKPESAKTQAMHHFKIKGTHTTNNITQSVIVSKILPMVENKGLKHLIVPDILNVTEKDYATKKGAMNMIKSLMEEGITSLDTFNLRTHKVYSPPIQCGIITGITSEGYHGVYDPTKGRMVGGLKHYLKVTGLLSRFTPYSYKYKHGKILKIFEFIEKEEYMDKSKIPKMKVSRVPEKIIGNKDLFKMFEIVSTTLGKESGGYGIRIQRTLQTMAKGNAMLNKRTEVTREDIDKMLYLSNWINYDFNPL